MLGFSFSLILHVTPSFSKQFTNAQIERIEINKIIFIFLVYLYKFLRLIEIFIIYLLWKILNYYLILGLIELFEIIIAIINYEYSRTDWKINFFNTDYPKLHYLKDNTIKIFLKDPLVMVIYQKFYIVHFFWLFSFHRCLNAIVLGDSRTNHD